MVDQCELRDGDGASAQHIVPDRRAEWHSIVDIRFPTLGAWNEIAAAKSLAKVRELQAAGRVGPDIPTNVYFFLEVQQH